jgi:hypothetical protein
MTRQTVSQPMKSIAGALLLALGFLLLFTNLDAVGSSLADGIGPRPSEGMEAVLTVGLAAIHAAQSYTFEHARFVSGVRQFLVSFWPLTLVIVGALLLRGAFEKFSLALSEQREYPR